MKKNPRTSEGGKLTDGIGKYYLAMLIALVGWASVFISGKMALNSFGPITFAWLRGMSGFLVILPFAYKRGFRFKQLFTKKALVYGLVGFCFNTVILHFGMQWCSANISAMAQAFMPVFMLVGGVLFLNEKITKWKEIGAVLAVVGILITCIGGSIIDENTTWYGIVMVAVAPVTWTIYTVILKKYDGDSDGVVISEYLLGCGSMITLPFAAVESAIVGLPEISLSVILLVAFAGIFCMGIANMSWTIAVSRIDASISGLCYNFCPISAVFIAVAFGETVSIMQWIGCVVVIAAILIGVKDEEIFKQKKKVDSKEELKPEYK